MDRIEFVRKIEDVIEGAYGCYTKTTEKKGEGFSSYNIYDVKWGQVDVCDSRIRVVLDLFPGRYSVEDLEEKFRLTRKEKGTRKTGFYLEKAEFNDPPFHDTVVISLYNEFFEANNPITLKLLDFVGRTAVESSFKTENPSKLKKIRS